MNRSIPLARRVITTKKKDQQLSFQRDRKCMSLGERIRKIVERLLIEQQPFRWQVYDPGHLLP